MFASFLRRWEPFSFQKLHDTLNIDMHLLATYIYLGVLLLLVNTGDGPDPDANYAILNRGKRHDYFTSCLPWPQKGPSVALPLGTSADVKWRSAPGNTPTMRYTAGGIAPAGALSALAGGG